MSNKLYEDEWLELFTRFELHTDYDGAIGLYCRACQKADQEAQAKDLSQPPQPLSNRNREFRGMPGLRKIIRIALRHIRDECLVGDPT